MSTLSLIGTFALPGRTAGSPRGSRVRRRCVLICSVLALALSTANVTADCPQGDRMSMLIEIERGSIPVQQLWDMGADIFGVDGNSLLVRVCQHMAGQLAAEGVAYEVIHEDIYEAYQQYREGLGTWGDGSFIRRDESFVDYHDLDATVAAMQQIADDHPDLAVMEVIGESIEGRAIHALRMSNDPATVDHDRPAMVVVGCHHAREWISVEVPLYLADYLANNYLEDGCVTRLLNYAELWIVPIVNPDGFLYSWTDDRFWRKNRRDNGDGTFGVDPNRNYAVGWGGEGSSSFTFSETYHGTAPFSEPETQAVRDLMDESMPNGREFASLLSYHNYSQLVMYPNGYTTQPVVNAALYEQVAGQMTQLINDSHTDPQFDYEYGQTSHILYIASGTTSDWAHNELGATSIIIELRPKQASFEVPPEQIIPTCEENLPAFLFMAETTMIPELEALDADLDGFVDTEDYCPNSPSLAAVDVLGCAETEQDVDNDGLLNAEDACGDSLPGQQVDADGCRVETLFTLQVSSNVGSVEVDVYPLDIDAAGAGSTGTDGLSREYAEETTIMLTAPEVFDGDHFLYWVLDGEVQSEGEPALTVTTSSDLKAEAVYVFPEGLEIVGSERIPDKRENGLAYMAPYSAQVVYTDGSVQPATGVIDWTLSDESIGLFTADGELLAYDVSSEVGEVEATFTAAVEFAETSFTSAPFKVTIFDAETMAPRCQEITLTGPDGVDSNAARTFTAKVLLDGELTPQAQPGDVQWTVSWAEPDEASAVPASMSADGVLSAAWVPDDSGVIVRAAYVNDNGTVCLAEHPVTISAGDPADKPPEHPLGGTGALCGAAGMIGLFGVFMGLIVLRITRR